MPFLTFARRDADMTDTGDNGGLEMVSGRGALRVQISGVKDEDLAKLLQDTANFVKNQARDIVETADDDEDLELMFKRVDLGDFVIVSVKR
jgi:hypothetical protein